MGKDNVLSIANTKWEPGLIQEHHRVIYSHKPIKYFDRIPLLVTHAGMMIGYEKQAMYLAAEKIFFTGVKLKA